MNTLVALGVGAAWLLSAASALAPSVVPHAIYFESAVVVVGFVLLGRVLEAQARRAAGAAVRALVARVPATARVVVGPAGALEERPAAAVLPGDLVQVWPGEALPVDGVVEQGRATLDTAALTGESAPVPAGPGDTVAAGALCAEGALWVRVSASGRRTGLARAARAVYEAQAHKAPVQRQVDAVSRRFVPAVLGVAVASAAGWLVAGAPVADAILAAVTVLVVACPCALGLATPTAVLVATGRAAREGIWFRDGAALEAAQAARTVVFDKTGTLSQGAFAVAQVEGPPTLLAVAAALEAESTHPLARALRAAAVPGGPTAQGLRSAPGDGVEGTIAGVRWRLGRAGWAGAPPSGTGDAGEEVAGTVVHLAADGQWAGAITLVDPPRPEAAAVVAALRAAGRRVVVLSGDGPGPTSRLAAAVGADAWEAGVRPAEKGARVLAWSADGPVVMVGDGVNDGPALAAAAVGVAMAEAADVARQAAGIQLARPDLRLVPAAIALSDATFRTIRHNLVWAFGYNVLALPLAAGALAPWGWRMSPMVAGAAMALSSVSVVLSSLRLRSVRLPAIP
jgi:Cu+-exporting ATPase